MFKCQHCGENLKSIDFLMQEWLPVISGKKAYFTAAAEYHQAAVSKEKGKYGEEVARLQVFTFFFVVVSFICSLSNLRLQIFTRRWI